METVVGYEDVPASWKTNLPASSHFRIIRLNMGQQYLSGGIKIITENCENVLKVILRIPYELVRMRGNTVIDTTQTFEECVCYSGIIQQKCAIQVELPQGVYILVVDCGSFRGGNYIVVPDDGNGENTCYMTVCPIYRGGFAPTNRVVGKVPLCSELVPKKDCANFVLISSEIDYDNQTVHRYCRPLFCPLFPLFFLIGFFGFPCFVRGYVLGDEHPIQVGDSWFTPQPRIFRGHLWLNSEEVASAEPFHGASVLNPISNQEHTNHEQTFK